MLKSIKIKNLNKTAIEKFLKKNKIRLASLALAVAFITPLAGCNKDKNKDEEPTTSFTFEV